MKRSNIVIDNIVKKSRLKSIEALKEELKIAQNSSLIRVLMQYFISSIEKIDYSVELNEISSISRTFKYIKPNNEVEFRILESYIKELKQIVKNKEKACENNQNILEFLKALEEEIGTFLIETRFEMLTTNDKIKEFPSVDDKKLKAIICDFIFKYRDYSHLNVLISLYPSACNIKSNNKTIVIKILQDYFSKLNNREFLAKVITLFISNANYSISMLEKNEIAKLCEHYSSFLPLKDLIFIKEIITTLGIKKEIDCAEKLNLFKKRFGIQDFNGITFRNLYETFPVDMTDRNVITIDCSNTLVRDDAFSIEKKHDGSYELGLYITDVSSIKKGSPLDVYAFNHFSTIYTKDACIQMIAEPFVYKFSLDKGLRRVMAFTFNFSSNLELIDVSIASAMIKVSKNLSYFETSEMLNVGNDFYPFLRNALDLSEAIDDSLGTIDKYHHIKEIVRELGGSMDEVPEKYLDTPGNRIIATFAVFLNNYIATMFEKLGLPFIYRVNEFETNENVQTQLRKYHRDKVICNMLKSIQISYQASTFSSINTGHKGLGLNAYTKATNPARYYPSLFIQRMLMDLFVYKIPVDEYVKKYANVGSYAQEFTNLQKRNCDFTYQYNKLCRRLNFEKNKNVI